MVHLHGHRRLELLLRCYFVVYNWSYLNLVIYGSLGGLVIVDCGTVDLRDLNISDLRWNCSIDSLKCFID